MDKLMTLCEAMIHSFLKLRHMSMTLASIRERSSMDEMTA